MEESPHSIYVCFVVIRLTVGKEDAMHQFVEEGMLHLFLVLMHVFVDEDARGTWVTQSVKLAGVYSIVVLVPVRVQMLLQLLSRYHPH